MKTFVFLSLVSVALGAGYGPSVPSVPVRVVPVYAAPVPVVPKAVYVAPAPKVSYAAPPKAAYVAPVRVEPKAAYVAPVRVEPKAAYVAPPAYIAPKVSAPAPAYVAPKITTAAPVYVAPKATPAPAYIAPAVPKAGYAAEEANPEPGYGIVVRHDDVYTPETKVDVDYAWTAPSYARVEKHSGYAPTVDYAAPVRSEGYAAATTYEAPASYGAPLEHFAELRAGDGTSRYAPESDSVSRAYLRLEQNIKASAGVHMADTYGNVMDAVYAPAAPDYKFAYGVEDPSSGDQKHVAEERVGAAARGSYSFLQPDGCTRTVRYMTDDEGFRALVEYAGPGCRERYAL